jgi:hypothetical protein
VREALARLRVHRISRSRGLSGKRSQRFCERGFRRQKTGGESNEYGRIGRRGCVQAEYEGGTADATVLSSFGMTPQRLWSGPFVRNPAKRDPSIARRVWRRVGRAPRTAQRTRKKPQHLPCFVGEDSGGRPHAAVEAGVLDGVLDRQPHIPALWTAAAKTSGTAESLQACIWYLTNDTHARARGRRAGRRTKRR